MVDVFIGANLNSKNKTEELETLGLTSDVTMTGKKKVGDSGLRDGLCVETWERKGVVKRKLSII
jgi:hypothetical protein